MEIIFKKEKQDVEVRSIEDLINLCYRQKDLGGGFILEQGNVREIVLTTNDDYIVNIYDNGRSIAVTDEWSLCLESFNLSEPLYATFVNLQMEVFPVGETYLVKE